MWDYFLYQYGNQIVLLAICVCFFASACFVKRAVKKAVRGMVIRHAAKTAMLYADGHYKDLGEEERLDRSVTVMEAVLKAEGVKLEEWQCRIYLEATEQELAQWF